MIEFHTALLGDDPQTLTRSLAAGVGLDIPESSLPIVTLHLVAAAGMAKLLFEATPDSDELAPATVFTLPVTSLLVPA